MQTDERSPFYASLLSFSDDNSKLITAGWIGVAIWDIKSAKIASTVTKRGEMVVKDIAIAKQDRLIVCSNEGVSLFGFDGNIVETVSHREAHFCAVSRNREVLGLVHDEGISVYGLANNQQRCSIKKQDIVSLAISPNGNLVAVGDKHGKISLFGAESGKLKWSSDPPGQNPWPATLPWLLFFSTTLVTIRHVHYAIKKRSQPLGSEV